MFGDSRHWSDEVVLHSSSVPAWQRQRDRRRRLALVNAVLAPYRVTVADWQGEKFVVRGATGRAELADSVGDLWQKAEIAAGRPIDPLDAEFLEALDGT
jgi:hypothetical protein